MAVVLGLGAGCGSGIAPPGKVSISLRFATPAEKLAVIDAGGVLVDRAKLRRYQILLARLDDRCRENRLLIAELVAESIQALEGSGAERTALELLERAGKAIHGDRLRRCEGVFATFAAPQSR